MKVLFAVSNESISESIVKKYQKNYKEIISYKNVYYFNAILKEIERDKSYDRIVISEDLEPFSNNNYETIDRFLFEKLDGISDEASNGEGTDIPIILICTDRRTKSDGILLKLFSIGVYNAIIGQDRSIDEVCKLISKPRTKKEAKVYYKIESEDASYQAEDEEDVSEAEIQNIIAHYKKLGKNTERYVDSFNNIASQYTDQQLRIIIKFLPLNVKAVLEAESSRYQEIVNMSAGKKKKSMAKVVKTKMKTDSAGKKNEKVPKLEEVKIDLLDQQEEKNIFEPKTNVIVPSTVNVKKAKKVQEKKNDNIDLDELETLKPVKIVEKEETVKKKRGRPKKVIEEIVEDETKESTEPIEQTKKRRGRPKKVVEETPQKTDIEAEDENVDEEIEEIKPIDLFDLSEDEEENNTLEQDDIEENEEQEEHNLRSVSASQIGNMQNLLTKDKKMVAFVGTSKNGTSFLVNNLAFQFARNGY